MAANLPAEEIVMERRLTAILALDVVGYSRLMAEDEAGTHARLQALNDNHVAPAIAERNGHIIKFTGDGTLAEFPSVVEAVACAIAIQEGNSEHQAALPAEQRMLLRAGVNIGDVIVKDGDIYGDGVNVAARLEELAEPGGIYVSRTVYEYTLGKVDRNFEPMGAHSVKNIPHRIDVYRVVLTTSRATPPRRTGLFKWLAVGATAFALVALAVGVWLTPWRKPVADAPPPNLLRSDDRPSLAVLPFDNLSGDHGDSFFADGMTDDLITDLSKISGLKVIARNTMFTYKDRPVKVCNVARELSVRHMLEGSVRRAGNRLRINAQLIECPDGSHVWADRYDRDASDVFALQTEVIRHIVDTLSVHLSPSERERVERPPTTNLEAYDYYLRGERVARTGLRRTYKDALKFYKRAIALDPKFAQAFAAMARTEATVMRLNYDDVLTWPVARKRAYEHAGRALEIDLELSLPWAVLAELQLVDRQYAEALKSAERAVAVAPGDPAAHAALGLVLLFSGRHADAVAALETAERLEPNLPTGVLQVAGLAYMLNDQPKKAVEVLERARDAAPDSEDTHGRLAAAYHMTGRSEAALLAAAAVARYGPNLSMELFRVKLGHFRDPKDLETILAAMSAGGLQRWPFGFRPGSRQRLSGPEIKKITLGRTWKGINDGAGPALMQVDAEGRMGFRTTTYFATGTVRVQNDLLCEHIESLTLGRTICGPIYRADPEVGDKFSYIYVNATKVFRFSLSPS
jgi:adenylate cyclase